MYRLLRKYLLMCMCLFMTCVIVVGCGKEAGQKTQASPKTLFAYVGANLKDPVTDLAKSYEAKTGVKIELTFNNSGALLNQIQTVKKGDIYMPGGMPFVKKAQDKGLLDQIVGPIAYHTPVIIVPKNNPAQIEGINDLAKEGVKLIIPDKEATAIGQTIYKIFANTGKSAAIERNIIANLETPAKVLVAITMGQGNAGVVEYSNTVNAKDNVVIIPIDPGVNLVEEIPIATLAVSENKEQAADFMNYVRENGPAVFEKYGFKTK